MAQRERIEGTFWAGCDVGSTTGKAVILGRDGVVASAILPSTLDPERTARDALGEAVSQVPGLDAPGHRQRQAVRARPEPTALLRREGEIDGVPSRPSHSIRRFRGTVRGFTPSGFVKSKSAENVLSFSSSSVSSRNFIMA